MFRKELRAPFWLRAVRVLSVENAPAKNLLMHFNNRSYHNLGFIIMPFASKESHETKPVNRLELSEVWINWMRRKVYFFTR